MVKSLVSSVIPCPFCIQMMDEGLSAKGVADDRNAVDLITLLDRATGE